MQDQLLQNLVFKCLETLLGGKEMIPLTLEYLTRRETWWDTHQSNICHLQGGHVAFMAAGGRGKPLDLVTHVILV